ncbi:hypothetical protein MTO96_009828 [Rhipicephalus appendiculatus]
MTLAARPLSPPSIFVLRHCQCHLEKVARFEEAILSPSLLVYICGEEESHRTRAAGRAPKSVVKNGGGFPDDNAASSCRPSPLYY